MSYTHLNKLRIPGISLFLLLIMLTTTTNAWALSGGANSPGTVATDAGIGSDVWWGLSNATSSNDSYAKSGEGGGNTTNYLVAKNFGFNIPAGVTIAGIEVEVERQGKGIPADGEEILISTPYISDNTIQLVKDGSTPVGTNQAGGSWSINVDETATYGSSTELWGTAWTSSEVNSSNFGLAVAADIIAEAACIVTFGFGGNCASVDHITITVYYTEAVPVVVASSGSPPPDNSSHNVAQGVTDAGTLFSQTRSAGSANNSSTDKDEATARTIHVQGPIAFSSKVPDADQVKQVYLKINNQIYPLSNTDKSAPYDFTKDLTLPPGTYPYTITADYGFTTLSQQASLVVEPSESDLISTVNRLFRKIFKHNPSPTENNYWQGRIKNTNVTTLPQLVGAMQWQSLFGLQ